MNQPKKILKHKKIIKRILPYIYIILLIGLLIINPVITLVPLVFAQEAVIPTGSTSTTDQANPAGQAKAVPILLSIQYGKGGQVQEYPISSGEAVFIPASEPNNPNINANPQETKESDAYRQQVGIISNQIAQKVAAVQKKQKDLDNEVYPVYKTPLQIEVTNLQNDLKVLEARREQVSAERTAKESMKPTVPPKPPSIVASGFLVRAILAGGKAKINIQTQGKNPVQTSIETPLGNWVLIFSAEQGQSQDIWAMVSPRG